MATGATGHIGLGKESTWGTGVVPTVWVPATESLSADFPELEVDVPYGGRNAPRSDRGRPSFSGSISGILAKQELLGHFFTAALGDPTTTGTSPDFVHTFSPRETPVSSTVGTTPYSAQVTRGGKTTRWLGGQLNEFTLNAPADGRVTLDTDWVFKNWDNTQSAATPTLETNKTFMHRNAAHLRASTPYLDIKSLTLNYTNNMDMDMTQDGTDELRATYIGTSRLTVDMTLIFANANLFDDFLAETDSAFTFGWELNATTYLKFIIPTLSVKDYQDPLSGRGILEASVQAAAEDAGSGLFTVELANTTETY
jgi:hypothetical protein